MNIDKCHKALLSLSQEFRTKTPPDLKSSMQCLQAILNLPVSPLVIAKTNYTLGSFIYEYTNDINVAQKYLQAAYEQSQTPELIQTRLKAVALLVEILLIQNQRPVAKQILNRAINDTKTGDTSQTLYWHYRFLLKLSHLYLEDKEFINTNNLLSLGIQTASSNNDMYTKTLLLVSKGMILLIAKKYPNALLTNPQQQQQQPDHDRLLLETLEAAGSILQSWQSTVARKDGLEVFFLVLQVCHHLNKGQNKSAKPCLKLLLQSMHILRNSNETDPVTLPEKTNQISPNMTENFIWMPKGYICVLVYLVNSLHLMQGAILEKAQDYTQQALVQIEELRLTEPDMLLNSFQVVLLEHLSMCHLVMGNRTAAIKETVQAIQICYKSTQRFMSRQRGSIRTLLGLYAMSMSMLPEAEDHFRAVMNDANVTKDLRMMSLLNLALCYLQDDTRRDQRRGDVEDLLSMIGPDQLNNMSYSLKAPAYYVYGLKAFCDSRFVEAKRNLRETLTITNGEDLNRLTSCSLVLLGKIFNTSDSPRESLNMITPAMKLAAKIPDIHTQLWAASVLREIYSRETSSEPYAEASNLHESFSATLHQDGLQASSSQEHNYVRWTDWR